MARTQIDCGPAVIVNGLPYYRTGIVSGEPDLFPDADDQLNISAYTYSTPHDYIPNPPDPDIEIRTYTAGQRAISLLPQHSEVRSGLNVNDPDPVDVWTAPSNGILRSWTLAGAAFWPIILYLDGALEANLYFNYTETQSYPVWIPSGTLVSYYANTAGQAVKWSFLPDVYP